MPTRRSPAPAGARAGRPVGQVAGKRKHVASVLEHGRGAGGEDAAAPVAFEELDADAPLEFGDALRQRRRGDAETARSVRPGGRLDNRDEVVELLHSEVRQVARQVRRLVQYC